MQAHCVYSCGSLGRPDLLSFSSALPFRPVPYSPDDYRAHTSCMTEAERYEKTVYRGPKKGDVNGKSAKKMSKQERWLECVADAAQTAPVELRPHFERMAMLDNVPFKPKQFRNFAMNSLPRGGTQQKLVDDMWNLLKGKFDKEMEKVNNQGGSVAKNGGEAKKDVADENAKQQKGEQDDDNSEPKEGSSGAEENKDSESLVDLDAKKIKKTMKSILRKAPNRTMKSKKLRKDILKTLALKKAFEKKVEGIMTKHVESNPKKLVFSGDGKKVTLLKKDK